MQSFLKSVLSSLLGGGLAFVLAILCHDYQVKRAVPAIFVIVLVFDSAAGSVGCLGAFDE